MSQQQAADQDDIDSSNEDNPDQHNNAAMNHANAHNIPYECTLSPKPCNLYELWKEYEHGIGGRKAAKDFSPWERGRVKSVYTRRLVIWDEISRLVRAGDTHLVAIDRIYQAYGRSLSVTAIHNKI